MSFKWNQIFIDSGNSLSGVWPTCGDEWRWELLMIYLAVPIVTQLPSAVKSITIFQGKVLFFGN